MTTTIILRAVGACLNLLALIAPQYAAKRGLALLCHPQRNKLAQKHKIFFDSAHNHAIAYDDGYVQAYRWGHGNIKLLFIHGWQSHSYLWKRYVESLDHSRYTIYAFDAPAHGKTSGDFLTLPMYSEVIGTVMKLIGKIDHVIAHSIGSFALLHRLNKDPQLTPPSIILLSSPGRVRDFFSSFNEKLFLSTNCARLIESEFETFAREKVDHFVAERYAESIAAIRLLIHDQLDPEIPVHYSREIHKHCKDSILIETRGLGHNLKSEKIVNLILNFISTGQLPEESMVALAAIEE